MTKAPQSFSTPPPATATSDPRTFTLSRGDNPHYRALLRVLDPAANDHPITLVVGAGTSLDAGLPSWEGLIRRVTEKIKDENSRRLALTDEADGLLRKAEYVLELALLKRSGTPEDLVRDALYDGTATTIPGQAARALAALVVEAQPRIRVVTTNFDDVLETALREAAPKRAKVTSYTLDEAPTWERDTKLSVLHLHGILERDKDARGHLILSESSFLKHGHTVRAVLTRCLERGPVVFIGLSLTDPNVVGPLWDTRTDGHDGTSLRDHPSFALHVPPVLKKAADLAQGSADHSFETIEISRDYGVKKYSYVEKKLGLRPIYLRSYGQMAQALIEMRLAAADPATYLRSRSPRTSPVYGHRLVRLLDRAYDSLGCALDTDAPSAEASFDLNRALRQELGPDAPLGRLLAGYEHSQKKSLRKLIKDHGQGYLDKPPLPEEHFALFVWLRSRERDAKEQIRYAINLIGSSSIAHGDSYALRQNEPISPLSQYPVAQAMFAGVVLRENLQVRQNPAAWRGLLCTPLRAWESDDTTIRTADAPVTIGGISLNSSHYLRPERAKTKLVPVSVLATLSTDQVAELQETLEAAVRRTLGLDHPAT